MVADLSEEEILLFLRSIERGEIRLDPTVEPQEVYAGCVEYLASNGWHITVFNDANEWDYIEEIIAADGRGADFAEVSQMPGIADYEPSAEIAWSRYRLPGPL